MKKEIIILFFILIGELFCQVSFKINTDKTKYEYGETIFISASLTNNADTTVVLFFSYSSSFQAEFTFDEYNSYEWTTGFPAVEEVNLPSNYSREYSWTFDPIKFGLPSKDGYHKIISSINYRLHPNFSNPAITLVDSIEIEAPRYLGGQLWVSFTENNESSVTNLKDSLGVTVLERTQNINIVEKWQIIGKQIDSLYSDLQNSSIFEWVDLNRTILYDSIKTITDIIDENKNNIPENYSLSQNYPNPFNPSTTIKYSIPQNELVQLKVYDLLGKEVAYLVNEGHAIGNYEVEFNATNLTSGVYFYRLQSSDFTETKKLILLR